MIVGIDLGTTNSLLGVWDGEARLIPNALGSTRTPSVVSLDRTGELVVGAPALERLTSHPELTVAAFKRHMGSAPAHPPGSAPFPGRGAVLLRHPLAGRRRGGRAGLRWWRRR